VSTRLVDRTNQHTARDVAHAVLERRSHTISTAPLPCARRFERFCEAFGLKASKDELKALFERYDADDSGSLVFREFSRAMLARTEVHRPK
tara:strand:- start:15 stop:287 length:273 start_codon:yes stop_codon:yes gene_type:complete